MKGIPLSQPYLGKEEKRALLKVLESGWLTSGPMNIEFEESFSSYIGVKHSVSMNSCTSALHVAIQCQGIKGEVILPSFTWVASANAILTGGAQPIFADVQENTGNLDPTSVECLITKNTEAIMPVHYAGQCADMTSILKIALKYNLAIIEDSAETVGGQHGNRMAGSFGTGCFSFFPTKNLTVGEGGMLTTNDAELACKARIIIGHGIDNTTYKRELSSKPWHREASLVGYNFRLSNLLAAIGVEQLKKLEKMNAKRRILADIYDMELNDIEDIIIPIEKKGNKHVYQMYVVRVRNANYRNNFVTYLRKKGIGASVHFDPPVHKMKVYKEKKFVREKLSVTEKLCCEVVTLPIYPAMKKVQVNYICEAIKLYFKNN